MNLQRLEPFMGIMDADRHNVSQEGYFILWINIHQNYFQYTNLQHKPMVVHKTLQIEKEFRINNTYRR